MLIHTVLFWLQPSADRAGFRAQLATLGAIPTVRAFHHGTPAAVERRPVVEASWDFGITVIFDDLAGHDAYQVHPIHEAFIAACKPLWQRVLVIDSETSAGAAGTV